jgi:integrase
MQAGVPAGHIAAVLGHSTIRMTERYAHVAPENAQAAVAKLEECTKIYTPRNDNVEVLR